MPLFVETLESRVLLSGTAIAEATPAPDFVASLSGKYPPVILPAATVKTTVRLTNMGGAMSVQQYVPVAMYVSDTPTLDASATPIYETTVKAKLKAGQTRSYNLKMTAPASLPGNGYYFIVQVNTDGAVVESNLDNNVVAGSFLSNPFGHYSGTVSIPKMGDYPIGFDLSPGVGSNITSSMFGGGSELSSLLNVSDANSTLKANGRYTVKVSGTLNDTAYGDVRFRVNASGTIHGQTMDGTIGVTVMGQSIRFSFTVIKDS